jgi:predicted SprT family Zn-dependent metalloprotease
MRQQEKTMDFSDNFAGSVLNLLGLIGFAGIAIWLWRGFTGADIDEYFQDYTRDRTLVDYRSEHRDSFRSDGSFANCHACGGRFFRSRWVGRSIHGEHFSYECRQCGVQLWRQTRR